MRQLGSEQRHMTCFLRSKAWLVLVVGVLCFFASAPASAQNGANPQTMMALDCGKPTLLQVFAVTTSCPALPTFSQRRLFGTGTDLTNSIAVGDMNSDGFLDIVEGNQAEEGSGQSAIYLNDGSGNFDWDGSEILFGDEHDSILSVAIGDVDADGTLDIVAGRESGGGIIFFNRNGFLHEGKIDCSHPDVHCLAQDAGSVHAVALGDMDGTGSLDVILGGDNGSMIHFNDGQDNFERRTELLLENSGQVVKARALAVADLDGKNGLDVVVGASEQPGHLFYNDGSGGFPQDSIWTFGDTMNETTGLAVADLDGQSGLDIVVSDDLQMNDLGQLGGGALYLNDGAGRFDRDEAKFQTATGSTSVALGDLDNNGFVDLVYGDSFAQGQAWLFGRSKEFSLPPLIRFGTNEQDVTSVAVADLNNDGLLDIALGVKKALLDSSQNVIYLSDRQSILRDSLSLHEFGKGRTHAVGDMDADIDLDAVVAFKEGGLAVYENDGRGQLQVKEQLPAGQARDVVVADVDGSHGLDIIAGVPGQGVVVWLQDQEGSFASKAITYSLPITSIAVGDLDGDSDVDIIAASRRLFVLVNNGRGAFAAQEVDTRNSDGANRLLLGDFDHDGALDLLAVPYGGRSVIYFNSGAGAFSPDRVQHLPQSPDRIQTAVVGDLNGDGFLDVVLGAFLGPKIVLFNDGTGKFMKNNSYELGTYDDNTHGLDTGDANMDGYLDLAVFDPHQPTLVYINDGTGQFFQDRTWVFGGKISVNSGSIKFGDMDGDGRVDLTVVGDDGRSSATDSISRVYFTPRLDGGRLVNDPPVVRIHHPVPDSNAPGYASSQILVSNVITVSYTLFDNEGDPAQFVRACYSLDGGGNWQPALEPDDPSVAPAVIVHPDNGCPYVPGIGSGQAITREASAEGVMHTFRWDTWASGLFGQSDDVVFRLEAYPSVDVVPNGSPGPFQRPFVAAQTFPFRVRGNQVQVVGDREAISASDVISDTSGAVVYRLPAGKERGAEPLGGLSEPFRAAANGYLQGRAEMKIDADPQNSDNLVALWPSAEITRSVPTRSYLSQDTFPITATANFTVTSSLVISDARRIGDIGLWVHITPTLPADAKVRLIAPRHSPTDVIVTDKPLPASHEFVTYEDEGTTVCPEGSESCQVYVAGLANNLRGSWADGLWTLEIANPTDAPVQLRGWGLALQLSPLHFTSAEPTTGGLQTYPVQVGGVQVLTVTKEYPLLLFDLDVALEWEASNDENYQAQLGADLRRASEMLYDWTNGQVALGNVRVYHDARRNTLPNGTNAWNDAHVRIYATNRLRPNADQGGLVSQALSETVTLTPTDAIAPPAAITHVITYLPGQVRMGTIWNRYGDASTGNLGEDWPAALAHELGHYLLFLDDNYLTLEDNLLVPLSDDDCPGAMNNPYSNVYSEFHPDQEWDLGRCPNTLSNQNTGRSDWKTIHRFYPWLKQPAKPFDERDQGPSLLPLAVTQVSFRGPDPASDRLRWMAQALDATSVPIEKLIETLCEPGLPAISSRRNPGRISDQSLQFGCPASPITSTAPLEVPIFYLKAKEGDHNRTFRASSQARAILFQGEPYRTLIDLGQPIGDQVYAYGARPTDRLCVYDPSNDGVGCEDIVPGTDQVVMQSPGDWKPQVVVSPITSRTLQISVTLPLTGRDPEPNLLWRLFPTDRPALELSHLNLAMETADSVIYSDTVVLDEPVLEGYAWVGASDIGPRQAVTEFAIGGNPVRMRGMHSPTDPRTVRMRGMHVRMRGMHAPAASTDGQVMVYPDEEVLDPDEEVWSFTLQPATRLPQPLPWATQVGRAYWLAASREDKTAGFGKSSITFEYRRSDVPLGQEAFIRMYIWDQAQGSWRLLDGQRNYPEYNLISAPLAGPGLYALFSHYEIPLQPGWNLIGYPVQTSGLPAASRPISDALRSIAGNYSAVYGYYPCDTVDPWKVFGPEVGNAGWVNDLQALDFGQGYWIQVTATEPITLNLRGPLTDTVKPSSLACPGTTADAAQRPPPTTFYGQVRGGGGFAPAAGLPVVALVDGTVCGSGWTRNEGGAVVYSVTVEAASPENGFRCGSANKQVTFRVDDRAFEPARRWDRSGLQAHTLEPSTPASSPNTLASGCQELVPDGDFEMRLPWMPSPSNQIALVPGQGTSGSQAVRIETAPKNRAAIEQSLRLPEDSRSLRLRFALRRAGDSRAAPEVRVLVDNRIVWSRPANNLDWQDVLVNLPAQRGRPVTLKLETLNDSQTQPATALIDNLSLTVCS